MPIKDIPLPIDDFGVPVDLSKNPDHLALETAINTGLFQGYPEGTYVVFSEGKLVAFDKDRDALFERMRAEGITNFVCRRVT